MTNPYSEEIFTIVDGIVEIWILENSLDIKNLIRLYISDKWYLIKHYMYKYNKD